MKYLCLAGVGCSGWQTQSATSGVPGLTAFHQIGGVLQRVFLVLALPAAGWTQGSKPVILDRYLQLIGQPQVFGTQYPLDPKLPHPITNGGRFSGRAQLPFDDTFLPAYLRRDFCEPDLEQQKKNLLTLNSGSYPRATMTLPGCER